MEEKLPGCVVIFFAIIGFVALSFAVLDATSSVTECGTAVVTDKYYSEYYVKEDRYNGKSFKFYIVVEQDGVAESVEAPFQSWEVIERGQTVPVKQKTNFLYSRKYVDLNNGY